MTQVYEELFRAWCVPYRPELVPPYLRSDPVTAYGQYAFETGFKLGMQLAASSLAADDLCELH
ncbi:MAG: hypothetical protein HDT18_08610 [Oscillibacter sp.]|nr:hypothetical protein [Oscillibacter sp.]